MARDTHRQRVYDAEDDCSLLTADQAYTIAQAQAWVNSWRRGAWARARFNAKALRPIPIKALAHDKRYIAKANDVEIDLGLAALNRPYVLLHELAHVMIMRTANNAAPHGRAWRALVLELVRSKMGSLAADQLRANWIAHGVPPV